MNLNKYPLMDKEGGDGGTGGGAAAPDNAGGSGKPGDAGAAPAAAAADKGSTGNTQSGSAAGGAGAATGKGEGAGAPPPDWRSALPEDLRASPALKNVKDIGDLAKQYMDAQAFVGNSIRIPSENASPEERAQFRQKLLDRVPGMAEIAADDPDAFRTAMRQFGAPDKPTDYKLPEVEGVDPERFAAVPGFNEWAHEANLTQKQFEVLARKFTEAQVEGSTKTQQEHAADMEALRREWGYAYDERTKQAVDTAKMTDAPADFIKALEEGRVPAAWMRYMHTMGERFGKDGGLPDRQQPATLTPAEAQSQYDEIMRNKDHPYWKAPHGPERQRVVAQVSKLKALATGKAGAQPAAVLGQPEELTAGAQRG